MKINSHNEWDTLKEVIVGTATGTSATNLCFTLSSISLSKRKTVSFSDKLFFIVSDELHDGCSTHPHNYYFELLSEVGIVGAGLLLIFFLIILKDSFHSFINEKEKDNLYLLIPLVIVFFLEIWPFKSTGSFFTTWNATFIWLNIAMLAGYLNQKKN